MIFERLLDRFKLPKTKDTEVAPSLVSEKIDLDGQTIFFEKGKMYKVYPSDKESWYDAKYLISDGILYDLEDVNSIPKINIPNFEIMDAFDEYGVTRSLDYVLRMKAAAFYNRNEKELCSVCLWKATELMLANPSMNWKKEDYYRIVYWHNELGMFEEAEKALNYIHGFEICTENTFDLIARTNRNNVFSRAEEFKCDLVVFHDYGHGCCSECAKMRGRVYSISGKSLTYPKLPRYARENGNFHSGCRCTMSLFMNDDEIYYKAEKANAKKASQRPWTDDRDELEIELYHKALQRIEADTENLHERILSSKQKGIDKLEYDKIQELLPENAPKSLTGYRRMKTTRSKNFIKLHELAKEKGIEIDI